MIEIYCNSTLVYNDSLQRLTAEAFIMLAKKRDDMIPTTISSLL